MRGKELDEFLKQIHIHDKIKVKYQTDKKRSKTIYGLILNIEKTLNVISLKPTFKQYLQHLFYKDGAKIESLVSAEIPYTSIKKCEIFKGQV